MLTVSRQSACQHNSTGNNLNVSSHSFILANSILIVRLWLVFCAFTNLLNIQNRVGGLVSSDPCSRMVVGGQQMC